MIKIDTIKHIIFSKIIGNQQIWTLELKDQVILEY